MRIKLLSSVVVRGHVGAKVGDVIDAEPSLAGELLGLGLGEMVGAEVVPIQNRTPVIENRDPIAETQPDKPSKRRQPK